MLTGSALIALALARGRLTPDEAWAASHVDEDWNIRQWGEDAEAARRRAARLAEFRAAAQMLALG
jgi:chaperone required for assembly of F1-ATPase